jgi:integrase
MAAVVTNQIAGATRGDGAMVVPLGVPALEVLTSLPRREDCPWVLPAATGNGHVIGLPRIWRKIARAAGLSNVRLHDLRHGFASVAAAAGSSLYILGKVLGHKQARTTEKYAHLDADPVQAVADRTARTIAEALKGGGPNNVLPAVSVRASRAHTGAR